MVALLVNSARQEEDDDDADIYLSVAALLCGLDWDEGAELAADLQAAENALDSAPSDPTILGPALDAAERVIRAADLPGPHPVLLIRTLDMAARVVARVYAATGDRSLLDQAVVVQRHVVQAAPESSSDLPSHLNNLSHYLAALYEATDNLSTLEEAAEIQRRAVGVASDTDRDLPSYLGNLAKHLVAYSKRAGDRSLLDEAVTVQRRAVEIAQDANAQGVPLRSNLAWYLTELYEVTSDRRQLDEAIHIQRNVVEAAPATSPQLSAYFNNLGLQLEALYHATGDRAVLDEAVDIQRRAVQATPETSIDLARHVNNLAKLLASLYGATGDRSLLEEAVETQRRAVQVAPETGTERPAYLNNLALQLADLYEATGDRRKLDEAVHIQRQAVQATPEASAHVPRHLNNLASRLADLYEATGDRRVLEEAVAVQRHAVEATPATSTDLPGHLLNLAAQLATLYKPTGDRTLLDEAVDIQRRAVEATPETSTERSAQLNNLACHLAEMYEATGTHVVLAEAADIQRRAVEATPETSTKRVGHLANLTARLTTLYTATGDPQLLDEARTRVADVEGRTPWERVHLAEARAVLARVDERRGDRFRAAAWELTGALTAFRDELARPGISRQERRDLAHRLDGMLGDLATNHVLAGDVLRAVEILEEERFWLAAPHGGVPNPAEHPIAVAWVVASRWETTVITTTDHRDTGVLTTHAVGMTREQIGNALISTLSTAPIDTDGSRKATETLCGLAGEIVATFPPAPRILVVPLGVCALLPYAAAVHPNGGRLIDYAAVTLAPSLAWARAAHRTRPDGRSVGAFHPGKHPSRPLDLREDRKGFKHHVRGAVLDQPTAELVLSHFKADTDIGHISTHGAYNPVVPLESWLDLETDLTIQAVLDHTTAPWLVNLSACETAIPDLKAAEQQISFPIGFLLGGAAHVLATLWPVGNTTAAAVNRLFYQQLADNNHPADALRHALQRIRHESESPPAQRLLRRPVAALKQPAKIHPAHPYWWAPFTHYGSPW